MKQVGPLGTSAVWAFLAFSVVTLLWWVFSDGAPVGAGLPLPRSVILAACVLGAQIFGLRRFNEAVEEESFTWRSVPRHLSSAFVGVVPAMAFLPFRLAGQSPVSASIRTRFLDTVEWNSLLIVLCFFAGLLSLPTAEFISQYFDRIVRFLGEQYGRLRAQFTNETQVEAVADRVVFPTEVGTDTQPVIEQAYLHSRFEESRIAQVCRQKRHARQGSLDFFRSVARELGVLSDEIARTASARELVKALQRSVEWRDLGRGNDLVARELAETGLVIVGILAREECADSAEIVAFVIDGPLDQVHQRYPTAIWATGEGPLCNAIVQQSGKHSPVDRVRYFVRGFTPSTAVVA